MKNWSFPPQLASVPSWPQRNMKRVIIDLIGSVTNRIARHLLLLQVVRVLRLRLRRGLRYRK